MDKIKYIIITIKNQQGVGLISTEISTGRKLFTFIKSKFIGFVLKNQTCSEFCD